MLKIGQLTIVIYAIAIFMGGLEGFIRKGSLPSIIASAIIAALLIVALRLTQTKPKLGLGVGALISLLTIGQFAPKFVQHHTIWPSGFYTVLGTLAALIIGAAFLRETENGAEAGSERLR